MTDLKSDIPPKEESKLLPIISLISGILSSIVVEFWFGISIIFSITALVTGWISMKKFKRGELSRSKYYYAMTGFFIGLVCFLLVLWVLIKILYIKIPGN
jgi:hypothetical protein